MSSSTLLAVAAGTAGVSMALAPLLQVRQIVRRQSSHDVSLGYLSVICVGFSIWLAYGLSIGNIALVVTNTCSLTVGITTLLVARRYRRRFPAPVNV